MVNKTRNYVCAKHWKSLATIFSYISLKHWLHLPRKSGASGTSPLAGAARRSSGGGVGIALS